MATSYRVILQGRSAVKIERARWTAPDHQLLVRDDYQVRQPGLRPTHMGLIYTFDGTAENPVSAIDQATAVVRSVTDQISAVHRAEIEIPKPRFALNMEHTLPNRELTQILQNVPELYHVRRNYDGALYRSLFASLDRYRAADAEKARRIDRALHYLRNSYLETDPIDRFEDAWTGIESINPLVREKHSLPTTVHYMIGTLLGQDVGVVKTVRDKRNDIAHSRVSFNQVLSGLAGMTVLVQRGLLAGVLDVLDVASDPQLLMLRPGLPVSSTPDLIITAVLHGLSVDEIRTRDVYPQLVLHGIETLKPNRDDAEALAPIAGTVHVGLTGFTGDWDVMELRMRVPGDPEGSGTPISLLVQKWTAPFRQATGSLPSPASGRAVVAARIERWQCPWIAAGGVFALGWMSGRLWLRLRHGT